MLVVVVAPIRELIPITRPSRSNTGPPESPPISVQSVPIICRFASSTRPSRTTGGRLSSYPPGCPIATTHCPDCSSFADPSGTNGNPPGGAGSRILIIPESISLFAPSAFARSRFPFASTTSSRCPGLPDTCPAVSTYPSFDTITPDPCASSRQYRHRRRQRASFTYRLRRASESPADRRHSSATPAPLAMRLHPLSALPCHRPSAARAPAPSAAASRGESNHRRRRH